MRQAGRYLPEYREIRGRARSFLDFCYTPELAIEATLQPIRRFGFDAAILFSDILVVPDAFGQKVWFAEGEGPRLEPVTTREAFAALKPRIDLEHLQPVFEAIGGVRAALPAQTALFGFCGAPWTVASYMIAGRGTKDLAPARLIAYRDPELFAQLIERLVEGSIDYLSRQFEAGVDAVQIFESFASAIPERHVAAWSDEPIRRIVAGVRARVPGARIIVFSRGAGHRLSWLAAATGADAIGIDWTVDPVRAVREVPATVPTQGNLDPMALVAGGEMLEREVEVILSAFAGRPHIFNLGHGILPETPIAHVERLVAKVRGQV
jgi:uroporphyrinogen decarboxylase